MQSLLGRVRPGRFLREYWRQQCLLVRAAMPQLGGLVDHHALIELAGRDDVESRLVVRSGRAWRVEHGPFPRRVLKRLPPRGWTLLVNGVENHLAAARNAQQAFDFISYARHDDVMISYAAPGGTVGPHFDSYDVFLVQAAGTRTWKASAQRDLALIEDAPLRLLRRFRPTQEWAVDAGDLLYVPARHAHHGVATRESITWSFGCRTPSQQELIERLLDHLPDSADIRPRQSGRAEQISAHPGTISAAMLGEARALVRAVRWNNADILRALGEYASEPRSSLVFTPAPPMRFAAFASRALLNGIELDLKTRLFKHGRTAFINGESEMVSAETMEALRLLADHRGFGPELRLSQVTLRLLYRWYGAGYIKFSEQ